MIARQFIAGFDAITLPKKIRKADGTYPVASCDLCIEFKLRRVPSVSRTSQFIASVIHPTLKRGAMKRSSRLGLWIWVVDRSAYRNEFTDLRMNQRSFYHNLNCHFKKGPQVSKRRPLDSPVIHCRVGCDGIAPVKSAKRMAPTP